MFKCIFQLSDIFSCGRWNTNLSYNATGKVRRMAKNIGFRMELLGTPKVRLRVPA